MKQNRLTVSGVKNTLLTNLFSIIFFIRLSINFLVNFLKFESSWLIFIIIQYKALVFSYLILFIQILLVSFSPPVVELISHPTKQEYLTEVEQTVKADFLSTNISIPSRNKALELQIQLTREGYSQQTIAILEDCLRQFEENHSEKCMQDRFEIPLGRDWFINAALISLARENAELYFELIGKAKEVDPNWIGWAH